MLPALFAATMFAGAALLFVVQPLAGKLLLPLVGGTPGVWNTCMVFFQFVLLAGYHYAHATIRRFGVRRQTVGHLLVLAAVLVAFWAAVAHAGSPVVVRADLLPADADYPVFAIGGLLAVAVGVPFFVLATTAPLLQRWFAATGHRSAADPYFLYAASNAGSLLGLLAYPFLIEPRLTLAEQQWAWAAGVAGYLVLVAGCATMTARRAAPLSGGPAGIGGLPDPVPRGRVLRWLALAALPSALLLGVTTHITTDVAPVPLLWVVPLALYLLSFVLVFARWPDPVHRLVGRVVPMLLLFVVVSLLTHAAEPLGLVVGLHLAAFFGVCLLCHGELAKDRPPAEQLTAFYFWLSLGGVVGGLAVALVAPVVFHRLGMVEYPLALALAGLVRPREAGSGPVVRKLDGALLLGLLGLAVALVLAVPRLVDLPTDPDSPDALAARLLRGGLMFGLPAAAAFLLVRKPARYALALGVLLLAGQLDPGPRGETLYLERNYFGVVRVTRSPDGRFVRMVHGTTLHGQQRADEPVNPRPMTYYHQKGPIGRVFATLPPERRRRVGVVGLGTGALAAYAAEKEAWAFFEIDPAVERIAEDPRHFTFLSSCWRRGVACRVVLGDARRQLRHVPDGEFDVLVLDAFSSDAIPIHLLTREAVALYFRKLAPHGVLAMHVSNVHLDLPPLVARLAADHDPPLAVRYNHDIPTDDERADGKTASQWVILARAEADLGPILGVQPVGTSKGMVWERLPVTPGPVWGDDFANILGVWKKDEE